MNKDCFSGVEKEGEIMTEVDVMEEIVHKVAKFLDAGDVYKPAGACREYSGVALSFIAKFS